MWLLLIIVFVAGCWLLSYGVMRRAQIMGAQADRIRRQGLTDGWISKNVIYLSDFAKGHGVRGKKYKRRWSDGHHKKHESIFLQ